MQRLRLASVASSRARRHSRIARATAPPAAASIVAAASDGSGRNEGYDEIQQRLNADDYI